MGLFEYSAAVDISQLSVKKFISLLNKQKEGEFIRSIKLHSSSPVWLTSN